MEKVIRDGKVAVLYSPGYGAGWYTWNSNYKECLFHPEIVKLVEEGKQKMIDDEFMKNLLKCDYFYTGGASTLRIEWLTEGTAFHVEEYDGAESIKTADSLLITA